MSRGNTYCMGDIATITADTLVDAAREHGVPNGFSPSWLVSYNVRGAYITPMSVGRVAQWAVAILWERGWDVSYSDRNFRIEKAGVGYDDD